MKIHSILLITLISSCNLQSQTHLAYMAAESDSSKAKVITAGKKPNNSLWATSFYLKALSKPSPYGPGGFVSNMLQDKAGNIWFGTWEGIFRYDGKFFTNFSEVNGLSYDPVFSIAEDKNGNLWFGTWHHGVYRYDPSAVATGSKSFTNFTTNDGLSDNYVYSILEDKDGNIWFGTDGGLSRYNGKSFTNFTTKEGLSHNSVYTMLEDKNGKLWFGTEGGVCYYNENSFTNFTNKDNKPFTNVRSIVEDKAGNLWFGSQDGVCRYDPAGPSDSYRNRTGRKSFTNFTTKEGLSHSFVWSVLEDKKGSIWLGVCDNDGTGGGLSRYNPAGSSDSYCNRAGAKSFTYITEKNGLINNRVFCMLEDKEGNIWFGTSTGVCHYDRKTFTDFTNKRNGC
ncbi:MAG: two-component regulator propeller domain-containing protein [Bacteroidia bacterium]